MEDLTSAFSVGAGSSGQRDQLWPEDTPSIVWRRFTNKSPGECYDCTSLSGHNEISSHRGMAPPAIAAMVVPIQIPSYSHFLPTKIFTEYTWEGASHPRQ